MSRPTVFIGALDQQDVDLLFGAVHEVIGSELREIKLKYRSLARFVADRIHLYNTRDSEPGELADTLATEKSAALQCFVAIREASVATDVQIGVLAFFKRHAAAVITDAELWHRRTGRQSHRNVRRIRVPCIC